MSEFCIIGSGISGSTIANLLNKKYSVILFDKARGPGGRASFKRIKGKTGFDHGTQYISPKTKEFKKFTKDLIKKRILKVWSGKHVFLNSKKKEDKKHLKVIGKNGNNDISKHLLKKINCNYHSELKKIYYKNKLWYLLFDDGKLRSFKNLILTCPFPQLKKLSKKFINNSFLRKSIKMDANITTMIAIKKSKNSNSSYLFDDPILGWAGNENSKKRFKYNKDLWVLQSTYEYGKKHTDNYRNKKKFYTNVLINKFKKLTKVKIKKIYFTHIHGWKYSSNSIPLKTLSYWDKKIGLGICGDWFGGPRLENGWLSANDLYNKIK